MAEYSFDRNALRDLARAGERLVALAAAGHVLVFDVSTLESKSEHIFAQGALCLEADDEEHVLLGLSSGSVVRLDLATRAQEEVAQVPGRPVWLGRRAGGEILIVYRTGDAPRRFWLKNLSSNRQIEVAPPRAFLLDAHDRLWLGGAGQGARLQVAELSTLRVRDVSAKGGWADIGGMTELSDGTIAVYGESPDRSGFVARISESVRLWNPRARARDSSLPAAPVSGLTHLVVDRVGHRVLAFSPEDVFVTDGALASWQPLDVVPLAKLPGRPEHVGRSPAVGRAITLGDRIVVATARDGLLVARGDRLRRTAMPQQNPVTSVREISVVGGLAVTGDGLWARFEAGRWIMPPSPPLPPRELLGRQIPGQPGRDWVVVRSLPRDARTRIVLAKGGLPRPYAGHPHGIADNLVTARWVDGGPLTILGSEESPVEPDDVFLSPDGQLWSVDPEGLWKFYDGHWRLHGKCPVDVPLRFVADVGAPWIALPKGRLGSSLIRFDANEGGPAALLDDMRVRMDGAPVEVRDALAWGKDRLLVASSRGLCVFDTTTRFCEPLPVDGLAEAPSLLGRDSHQRVWLAGRGLWALEGRHARALHPLLPFLGDGPIADMRTLDDGRLVLALESRGVAIATVPAGLVPFGAPRSPAGP